MARRKCGEMVGSPPENWTLIWRRGTTSSEASRMRCTSSHSSSWTNPTWLASMKHGSHIMLQRLVRSTVRTAPRPYLMVEVPWFLSRLLGDVKSRPGKSCSMRALKARSVDITSSMRPCFGHVLLMSSVPSRASILARISPGRPSTSTRTSACPATIESRTSFTHCGQSESVSRGHPSGGKVRSRRLSSGAGAHGGWGDGCSKRRLYLRTRGQSALANDRRAELIQGAMLLRATSYREALSAKSMKWGDFARVCQLRRAPPSAPRRADARPPRPHRARQS